MVILDLREVHMTYPHVLGELVERHVAPQSQSVRLTLGINPIKNETPTKSVKGFVFVLSI